MPRSRVHAAFCGRIVMGDRVGAGTRRDLSSPSHKTTMSRNRLFHPEILDGDTKPDLIADCAATVVCSTMKCTMELPDAPRCTTNEFHERGV